MIDEDKAKVAVKDFLTAIGENPEREGLKETPRRVVGYWKELLEGQQYTNQEISDKYSKLFATDNPTMIVKNIDNVFSHCEHHLALMYNMDVTVAYLPNKKANGKYEVIGLSKIPRIVDLCAKRLQLQEKLTNDIAECIHLATHSKDVLVYITADHACVSARGAKSDGKTSTIRTTGRFEKEPELVDRVLRQANGK